MSRQMKSRFSIEDHLEIARHVVPMARYLTALDVKIHKGYPHNHRLCRQAQRSQRELDRLRSELDDVLFHDHRGIGFKGVEVYYGPDDSVRSGKKPLARPRKMARPNGPAPGARTTSANAVLEVAAERRS